MSRELHIALRTGAAEEHATRTSLQRILAAYDFSGLIFTHEIEIARGVVPHSHPVLTLNTAFADDSKLLLAEFLHEQLHWFEEEHAARRDRVIARTASIYPIVPTAPPEGAAGETSTRLHLLVCYWEYQALKCLLGHASAHDVMCFLSNHHYCWVYRTVLKDEVRIGQLLATEDLFPERLRAMHRQVIHAA
jgi:hypothetical protein